MRSYTIVADSDFLARCRDEVLLKALTRIAQSGMKEEAVLLAAVLTQCGIELKERVTNPELRVAAPKPDGIPF